MAYKQKGCTPITAKLKKTTKGGMVQQPLLNMGAPVKMKMESSAKQDKKYITPYREKVALQKERDNYEKELKQNKLDKSRPIDEYRYPSTKKAVKKRMENFESKYGARVRGEEGWAADDLARKNKTGQYAIKKETTKKETTKKETTKKDTTKENNVTGKIGSELRRKQYDKLGWAYDDTIKAKPKAKTAIPKEVTAKKAKVADVVKESKIITPNNNAKVLDKKTIKKVDRKTKSAEKKESRAAGVRQKGIEALKSGNKQKALRLKRREERINKRAAKKRGQAAKAINPDK